MRRALEDLPPPDPTLHPTGDEGVGGTRGRNELRLLEHFGLCPSSHVLDVGCGIGRLAYECASYLDTDATYTGLDIAPPVIDWLNTHYAPRLPGFRFDLLDVYNERYRPDGDVSPEQIRFPYENDRFTVACAFEVFMHVSLDGVRHYLREIARVLRPGGVAVVTLVVIYPNEQNRRPLLPRIAGPVAQRGRAYECVGDGEYSRFPERTSTSMAYDVGLIRSAIASAGLDDVELIKGFMHTPLRRPGLNPAIEPPPVSHPCDVFAAHKRAAVNLD
jgi:SAM-dependent methyltransferase